MIREQRDSGKPVIVLDAGNTFFSGTRDDINKASEGRLTVEAMNLMAYDAMALGPKDLAEGPEMLKARMDEATFAVVSANLTLNGEPFAEPFALIERDGLKIAVLGLTAAPDDPGAFTVSDPLEAARRYIPELRSQADVLVVLSNLGQKAEADLLVAATGADVIVNGGSGSPTRQVVSTSLPALVRAGGLGEYLGATQVRLDDEDRVVGYGHASLLLSQQYLDDPEMARLKLKYAEQYGQ